MFNKKCKWKWQGKFAKATRTKIFTLLTWRYISSFAEIIYGTMGLKPQKNVLADSLRTARLNLFTWNEWQNLLQYWKQFCCNTIDWARYINLNRLTLDLSDYTKIILWKFKKVKFNKKLLLLRVSCAIGCCYRYIVTCPSSWIIWHNDCFNLSPVIRSGERLAKFKRNVWERRNLFTLDLQRKQNRINTKT